MRDFRKDHQQAAQWAYEMVNGSENWAIFDTETTGLGGDAQICQVGLIAPDGSTLLDALVRPTIPIPADATKIHGITDEMVVGARSFPEVFMELWQATGRRQLIIYNASYDIRLVYQSLKAWNLYWWLDGCDRLVAGSYGHKTTTQIQRWTYSWINGQAVHCAMDWYSEWCGDWSDYHGNYRWQKLPGGDHTAIGDCKATLAVLQRMAASYEHTEAPELPIETPGAKLVEMPTLEATAPDEYSDIPF
ncbi:MAG TPA: 3'-5' exonuclease [Trichocoleus sp.]|jgi:DNA polymerase-3 subunit epsilon